MENAVRLGPREGSNGFLLGVTFDCVPVGGGIFFFPSEGQGCVRWYILECL